MSWIRYVTRPATSLCLLGLLACTNMPGKEPKPKDAVTLCSDPEKVCPALPLNRLPTENELAEERACARKVHRLCMRKQYECTRS